MLTVYKLIIIIKFPLKNKVKFKYSILAELRILNANKF